MPRRSSDTERNLKAFLDLIASFTASAFIFCQGVLGGVSLILFYLLVRMDDTSFMRVYSPIAADGQKAFLFLSTVSFVAALDKWTKDQMASWQPLRHWPKWMEPWQSTTELRDLFHLTDVTRPLLTPYLPNLRFQLLDLSSQPR